MVISIVFGTLQLLLLGIDRLLNEQLKFAPASPLIPGCGKISRVQFAVETIIQIDTCRGDQQFSINATYLLLSVD